MCDKALELIQNSSHNMDGVNLKIQKYCSLLDTFVDLSMLYTSTFIEMKA